MFFELLLVLLSIISRFIGLDWGEGFFFHPDENNMATALSQLSWHNFNPHFFAYGQFPLYLSFLIQKITGLPNSFASSIYVLRFISAVFSTLSLFYFYKIAKHLKLNPRIFTLLLVFTPGLIQLSHFGTTESLLLLTFAMAIYYSLSQNYLIASVIVGLGVSAKISGLIFFIPIIVSVLSSKMKITEKIGIMFACFLITATIAILFSPYNLISFSDFLSSIIYETSVATGSLKVFYTNQFLSSVPYLFQFRYIFPYVFGLPIFVFGIIGFIVYLVNYRRLVTVNRNMTIVLISSFLYFLYFGQVYTKWTRFMSPIFFIFPLFATYFYSKIKPFLKVLFVIISIIPGIIFHKVYLNPDIRLIASDWINKNISPDAKILSESGNVINLPIVDNKFLVTNFDFYNLDADPLLQKQLSLEIYNSDYILVPSRRVFKNQKNPGFPYSDKYYQSLFSGSIGFTLVKTLSAGSDFLLDYENAEETFTVFDQPTIRIFKKTKSLTINEIEKYLTP